MNPFFVRAVLTLLQLVWTHPLSEPPAPLHAGVDAAGRVSVRREAPGHFGVATAVPPPQAPGFVGPFTAGALAPPPHELDADGQATAGTSMPPLEDLPTPPPHGEPPEAEGHVSAEEHVSTEPAKLPPSAPAAPDAAPPFVPEAPDTDAKLRRLMRRAELHATKADTVGPVVEVKRDCLPAEVLNPPEASRTYSSVYRHYAPGTYHARSMLDSPLGWQALHNAAGESMTIDLGSVHVVHGTVTQGRAIERHPEWVEEYTVQYSVNGEVWKNAEKTFKGNNDSDTKVENHFDGAVRARFVKLTVKSWHSHVSMRAGVLTCEPCAAGPTLNPPEEGRNYSSVLDGHNETVDDLHARSRLNSSSAWSPMRNRPGEWMTINLGRPETIRGTVLQGANSTIPSWVVTYRVQLSMDGETFKDAGEVFLGNWDESSDSEQLFGVPMRAQYLRLVVEKWHGSISMRAGVLTCSH